MDTHAVVFFEIDKSYAAIEIKDIVALGPNDEKHVDPRYDIKAKWIAPVDPTNPYLTLEDRTSTLWAIEIGRGTKREMKAKAADMFLHYTSSEDQEAVLRAQRVRKAPMRYSDSISSDDEDASPQNSNVANKKGKTGGKKTGKTGGKKTGKTDVVNGKTPKVRKTIHKKKAGGEKETDGRKSETDGEEEDKESEQIKGNADPAPDKKKNTKGTTEKRKSTTAVTVRKSETPHAEKRRKTNALLAQEDEASDDILSKAKFQLEGVSSLDLSPVRHAASPEKTKTNEDEEFSLEEVNKSASPEKTKTNEDEEFSLEEVNKSASPEKTKTNKDEDNKSIADALQVAIRYMEMFDQRLATMEAKLDVLPAVEEKVDKLVSMVKKPRDRTKGIPSAALGSPSQRADLNSGLELPHQRSGLASSLELPHQRSGLASGLELTHQRSDLASGLELPHQRSGLASGLGSPPQRPGLTSGEVGAAVSGAMQCLSGHWQDMALSHSASPTDLQTSPDEPRTYTDLGTQPASQPMVSIGAPARQVQVPAAAVAAAEQCVEVQRDAKDPSYQAAVTHLMNALFTKRQMHDGNVSGNNEKVRLDQNKVEALIEWMAVKTNSVGNLTFRQRIISAINRRCRHVRSEVSKTDKASTKDK
ncbi:uncharacterized protein LOC144859052 [Branchiostoma floridae x Branchiostoma japonicum]